jgi:hypothetical protein
VAGNNDKSSFLFGLTLTELAFILFFILLFFASLTVREKSAKINQLNTFKDVVESIPEYKEKTKSEREIWLKELVEKNTLSTQQQELIEKITSLNKENETYKKIVAAIPALKTKTDKEKAEWLKELIEKNDLNLKSQKFNKQLVAVKERLEKFEKELKLKKEQITKLEKGVKGLKGNRYPDCWQDEKGKYEIIYNIILRDKGITTYRGYKKYLEQKFQEIPEANNIIGTKNITISEFKEKTREVFKWSKNAKPECRHWVRIFDETSSSNRSTYKIPLRGIEHYFYKQEYKMTYSEYKETSELPIDHRFKDKQIKKDVSSSNTSKQLNNEATDTDGYKTTDELIKIIKKRLAEENRLEIKPSRNKSLSKSLDLDSKVIKSSEPDLLEQLKKLKEIYSNPLKK